MISTGFGQVWNVLTNQTVLVVDAELLKLLFVDTDR
jgi:hypothetical protein